MNHFFRKGFMMLHRKQMAIIGGDQRYVHMIERLATHNAELFVVGFADISFAHDLIHKCSIDNIPFQSLDAIILPVHGMDKSFSVDQYFPPGNITLTKELLEQTPMTCKIFSGTANSHLKQLCEQLKRELVILYEQDDVAILNSKPTAEATLQLAMQHTLKTIHESHILIAGFGKVAQAIAHLFQAVGAHVHIVARRETDFATAKIRGYTPISFQQLTDVLPDIDICINTVPHLIFTADVLDHMPLETLLIDIASAPGGTDFSAAQAKNIQAIHALGLPGKTAPLTAGEIIAQPIINLSLE